MLNWSVRSRSIQRQHEFESDVLVLFFASYWPCVFGQVPSLFWAYYLTKESHFFLSSSSLFYQISPVLFCYYLWSIIERVNCWLWSIFICTHSEQSSTTMICNFLSLKNPFLCGGIGPWILSLVCGCWRKPKWALLSFQTILFFYWSITVFLISPHYSPLPYPPQLPLVFQTILEMSCWNVEFFRESSIRDRFT